MEIWSSAFLSGSARLLESDDEGGFHSGFRETDELDRDTWVLTAKSFCPIGLSVGKPAANSPPKDGPTGVIPPEEA